MISCTLGSFISVDVSIRKRNRIDVGRMLISRMLRAIIGRVMRINIGGDIFEIRMVEDPMGESVVKIHTDCKA